MQAYLVYAPQDSAFAQKLSSDLHKNGIRCIPTASEEQLEVLAPDTPVIIALSSAATKNAEMRTILEYIVQSQNRIITLRVGPVDQLPKVLRGVLPLDFSHPDSYDDSLLTLLEDLAPPTTHDPLLPGEIQAALASPDAQLRMQGIEMLGNLHSELNDDSRELALQILRDMAFKDPDSSINHLARSTLQLLSTPATTADTAPLGQDTAPLAHPPTPPPAPEPRPLQTTRSENRVTLPLWQTSQWWSLPVLGVFLALMHGLLARDIFLVLPVVAVWIILPWLNVQIRDGGKLDWRMPGPLVGNGVIALILALVGLGISIVLSDVETVDFLGILVLSVAYGTLIGWLSALYVRSER